MDVDLESVAITRTSLVVKIRPGKVVIKRRVALVFKAWQDGLKLVCKCKVSREEVEAFAEEEAKADDPPTEGTCKSSSFTLITLSSTEVSFVFPVGGGMGRGEIERGGHFPSSPARPIR